MFKRISITLGAVAVLTLGAAAMSPSVSAHGGGDGGGDTPRWENWLLPGVLEAEGDGIAAAAGLLNLRLCAEEGLLLAKGEAAVPDGTYDDSVEWLGLHVYFGFHGCAEVEGARVAALVVGHGLTLRAEGIGIAFLKGEGSWAKSGGETGSWTEEGAILKIGSKLWEKTPTPVPHEEPTEEPGEDPAPTPTPHEDGGV
jgi:hypothetical protein